MLLFAVLLAVSFIVILLAVSCVSMAKDWHDAQDELNERLETFYRVALSVKEEAGGEHTRLINRRAAPLSEVLQAADDELAA